MSGIPRLADGHSLEGRRGRGEGRKGRSERTEGVSGIPRLADGTLWRGSVIGGKGEREGVREQKV